MLTVWDSACLDSPTSVYSHRNGWNCLWDRPLKPEKSLFVKYRFNTFQEKQAKFSYNYFTIEYLAISSFTSGKYTSKQIKTLSHLLLTFHQPLIWWARANWVSVYKLDIDFWLLIFLPNLPSIIILSTELELGRDSLLTDHIIKCVYKQCVFSTTSFNVYMNSFVSLLNKREETFTFSLEIVSKCVFVDPDKVILLSWINHSVTRQFPVSARWRDDH